MLVIGLVLAVLAALLHVYIFVLESLAWTGERARATFGIASAEEAATTRQLAFNQGFYNLFLAVVTLLGVLVIALGSTPVGTTLVLTGVGSMTAAALVLLLSSPQHRAAALKQGTVPLLAAIAVVVGLAV
ncbi:membrane protein [Tersicoccus solisilvae]|uniref:Membrane protein n=1 Tax=Tersicoccus solisilvae TaxID=1882339 RepID=A0ABQ1NP65_9MICC|nr:DUF1304 domain-containing protein [Tersicoccus solisilvae]GGC82040.1 membrane protein [Tersicoccus solisilvae]